MNTRTIMFIYYVHFIDILSAFLCVSLIQTIMPLWVTTKDENVVSVIPLGLVGVAFTVSINKFFSNPDTSGYYIKYIFCINRFFSDKKRLLLKKKDITQTLMPLRYKMKNENSRTSRGGFPLRSVRLDYEIALTCLVK